MPDMAASVARQKQENDISGFINETVPNGHFASNLPNEEVFLQDNRFAVLETVHSKLSTIRTFEVVKEVGEVFDLCCRNVPVPARPTDQHPNQHREYDAFHGVMPISYASPAILQRVFPPLQCP